MPLHLEVSSQSRDCENIIKKHFYKSAYLLSKKHSVFRLSGPVIGVVSGALTIATRVSLLAENVFKGLINILGSPFSTSCSISRGLNQLTIQPLKQLFLTPFSVLSAITGLFTKTFGTFFSNEYLYTKWCEHTEEGEENHDPALNEEKAIRARFREREAARARQLQQEEAARKANEEKIQRQRAEDAARRQREARIERGRPMVIDNLNKQINNHKTFLRSLKSYHEKINITNDRVTKCAANSQAESVENALRGLASINVSMNGLANTLAPDLNLNLEDHKRHPEVQRKITELDQLKSEMKKIIRDIRMWKVSD